MTRKEAFDFLLTLMQPEFGTRESIEDELKRYLELAEDNKKKADRKNEILKEAESSKAAAWKLCLEHDRETIEDRRNMLAARKARIELLEALKHSSGSASMFTHYMNQDLETKRSSVELFEERIQRAELKLGDPETCDDVHLADFIKRCRDDAVMYKASSVYYSREAQKLQLVISNIEAMLDAVPHAVI